MQFFHGSHTGRFVAHEGLCLTTDEQVAIHYAGPTGKVFAVEISIDGLTIEDCDGYDRDENEAPADRKSFRASAAARGVDILRYEDEDDRGQQHTCYRLVSDRAVAAA